MTSITGTVNAVLEMVEYGWEIAHLESLEANPRLRPAQVALASRLLLHDSVCGGVLMGDFNAIQRSDTMLPV